MTLTCLRGLIVVALLWAIPLNAHQQKEAITRVLFNARTGNIEVMHRFLLHDAEHAVKAVVNADADILGSEQTRQSFSNYVYQHFSISDQQGRSIVLTPVGHEMEGRFIWVYAEAAIPEGLTALSISHNALRDIWPDQVNLVNVERDDKVKSATFRGGNREMLIEF